MGQRAQYCSVPMLGLAYTTVTTMRMLVWPAPVSDWPLNSIDRVGGVGRGMSVFFSHFIYNTCFDCVLNSFNFVFSN